MIETITIITLSLLALIIFRPGTTPPLESLLTINRIGQFHAVLAPKINLAQPLLENISAHISKEQRQLGNTQPIYFKVHDRDVKSHGYDFYLLAATLRDGMLYFQATSPDDRKNTPHKNNSHIDIIREFSEAELARHPGTAVVNNACTSALMLAIQAVAKQHGATITLLEENS
jgi:hypothetical protein